MGNNQEELKFENEKLTQTLSLAQSQLDQARERSEESKSAIIAAKEEMRENASHSVSNLWSSDGFEALVELSQYANPVTEEITKFEATEKKIEQLENLIKSPYFARIDFRFDDEKGERGTSDSDAFENIYIGRTSLMDEDSYEMYVYDWRSPIASVFYRFTLGQAYYDAPAGRVSGEVNLKRQFEIKNSILEYFFDADVQIIDEFLRKMLSQNTSTKMKSIVETIQKDQDVVIRDMKNDLMMVQGVAGSGKTSIALHRVAYLMYQGLAEKLSASNIIIISPNTLFEQYISKVLPELGEENVVSVVFEEILTSLLPNKRIQSRSQFLENLITGAPKYRSIIKDSIEFKTSRQFSEALNRFIDEIPHRWIDFEDVYYKGKCIADKELLKEKVLSRAKTTPLGWKLEQLEDFILELIRESAEGPVSRQDTAEMKNQIRKYTRPDIEDLYKKLVQNTDYFCSLFDDSRLPSQIEEILKYTQENLDTQLIHYDDAIILVYLHLKINEASPYKNIRQVVIDEAQDYYPLQYEIFHLLFPKSKFTVLGDINQTLEKEEDLTLYDQIRAILDKKKSSLVTMDKSFRCTNEILNFSAKFIKQTIEIKSFNREGDQPEIYTAASRQALSEMITAEIQSCLEKGYRSIGLICKSEKNAFALFKSLKGKCSVKMIKSEGSADLEGVFIIPVYMSKGLEFDAVLICDADSGSYHSEDDKKLLYIASTRALHRLNLFCTGEASPLLF